MTSDLVRPKPGERWLVVTSAVAYAARHGRLSAGGLQRGSLSRRLPHGRRNPTTLRPFGYASGGLRLLDAAVKEWIGLVAYRLTGRTDALLPGP